jgi:hypothetical protein
LFFDYGYGPNVNFSWYKEYENSFTMIAGKSPGRDKEVAKKKDASIEEMFANAKH